MKNQRDGRSKALADKVRRLRGICDKIFLWKLMLLKHNITSLIRWNLEGFLFLLILAMFVRGQRIFGLKNINLAKVCNWVSPLKKFFYYGHFSEDQGKDKHNKSVWRIDKAGRAGFQVKTKIIKMVPHYDEDGTFVGKFPKCNFDVEMTMTMLQKIDKYDTVMLFSGDSDFGGLLGYLKSKGKKVVIVCTRNRMSTELQTAADKFIPAENLAQFLQYSPKTSPPEQ